MGDEDEDYGISPAKETRWIEAPAVDVALPKPEAYRPGIGLIGAGGISEFHLKNYLSQGWNVAAIASRTISKAEAKRDEFYPGASVHADYRELLARDDIDVVDVTPHPEDRLSIVRDALEAGKHVLSQKPFVLDLEDGRELVELAAKRGVHLAVNQNGRWAPHFHYLRKAVGQGLIGEVTLIDFNLQWDQTWIAGNAEFERIRHLILFDFAIHWFDITCALMGEAEAKRVTAVATRFSEQVYGPAALGAVIVEYPEAQVRMSFHGHTRLGEEDVTTVVGTKGTLRSRGPGLNEQPLMQVYLEAGQAEVPLQGCWFEDGFAGAMGELLSAIEEGREPNHHARGNLRSLALCFAAVASAESGQPVEVGTVERYPG